MKPLFYADYRGISVNQYIQINIDKHMLFPTFNPLVAGSNPARPTTNTSRKIKGLQEIAALFCLLFCFAIYPLLRKFG